MSVFLTIGTYDGVHLGHQKIIKALIHEGLKRGMHSALAYFPLPPKLFFSGETENCLITLPEEREELVRSLRVENISQVPFNTAVSRMSAEKFFTDVILKVHDAAGLCVGKDFAFGHNRRGNAEFLRKHCAAAGLRFKAMPFITFDGHKISSSLIRTFLRNGRVDMANRCLGWNYTVSGKVVKGAGIGRGLGFPTANIDAHPAKILPPGIFTVKVRLAPLPQSRRAGKSPLYAISDTEQTSPRRGEQIGIMEKGRFQGFTAGAGLDKEVFYGVANVGRRPTVSSPGGRLLLEVHILDFDRDIYGRALEVEFIRHLRSEKHFNSREALQRQILKDIKLARTDFHSLTTTH